MSDRARPMYMIGVVAEMLKVHPQTLRFYEKKGLLKPSRTEGRTRLYSQEDVEELARLLHLTRDLGVNLAGVEVILHMRRQLIETQARLEGRNMTMVLAPEKRPNSKPKQQGAAGRTAEVPNGTPADLEPAPTPPSSPA